MYRLHACSDYTHVAVTMSRLQSTMSSFYSFKAILFMSLKLLQNLSQTIMACVTHDEVSKASQIPPPISCGGEQGKEKNNQIDHGTLCLRLALYFPFIMYDFSTDVWPSVWCGVVVDSIACLGSFHQFSNGCSELRGYFKDLASRPEYLSPPRCLLGIGHRGKFTPCSKPYDLYARDIVIMYIFVATAHIQKS